MQTFQHSGNRGPGCLASRLLFGLMRIVPRSYKRRFLISSLIPKVSKITTNDREALEKLNALIVRAKDHKFLQASMIVSDLIWSDIEKESVVMSDGRVMTLEEAVSTGMDSYVEALTTYILERVPANLRYGSLKLMRHDIASTLTATHLAAA